MCTCARGSMQNERGANVRATREHVERERSERDRCTGACRVRGERTRELHGSMQSERGANARAAREHAELREE